MTQQRIALFAGSFDPFTIGHKSIVDRGLQLFDGIVIAIGINPAKKPWQPLEQRIALLEKIYADDSRIKIATFSGLTVDAARRFGASFLLRGVRTVADFEYERQLADINRNLSGIESVLIYALPQLASLSSSAVRELASHGVDISPYVPTI
jgi:pantetheine-phosphate adenylyltransferase